MFSDSKFLSAKDKDKILKQWKRFLKTSFAKTTFPKALYEHLHLHCGFIAHYDKETFWRHYFVDPKMTQKFLMQFDRDYDEPAEGMKWWKESDEYGDLNKAMIDFTDEIKRSLWLNLLYDRDEAWANDLRELAQQSGQHPIVSKILITGENGRQTEINYKDKTPTLNTTN